MSHFDAVSPRPELARSALRRRFAADPRPDKLLLATGAFKDKIGRTPVLECVRLAAERVHAQDFLHDYLPEAGDPAFVAVMNRLLFGESNEGTLAGRACTAHTPGGTAALWIGGMLIHTVFPAARIWVSRPTWSNHVKVFEQAGLKVGAYPYCDPLRRELLFDEMLEMIASLPQGDVVFLQAATHNPTGLDPSSDQWQALRDVVLQRALIPFFDVAFFGFSRGLREDLQGLSLFCDAGCDVLIASSFSKSFSLYNERVGALSVLGATSAGVQNTFSHVLHLIRGSYSNPPLHGAAIVAEILNDRLLFTRWESDLQYFRDRIGDARVRLSRLLQERGVSRDVEYLVRERGLFTRLDLEATQIERLREEHALYLGGGGQLNVTAIPDAAIAAFCDRIAPLLR